MMLKPLLAAVILATASAAACAADGGIAGLMSGGLPPVDTGRKNAAAAPEEPGESVEIAPWGDWTEGRTFTRLTRVNILASFGMTEPSDGVLTARGEQGPGLSLDAGYAFAPFLSVGFSLDISHLSQSSGSTNYMGSMTDFNPSGVTLFLTGLEVKLRLPFNLIGPGMFRFSKAREGLGLVPAARFGFGAASVSKMTVDYWVSGVWHNRTVFDAYAGSYFNLGFDIEIRWKGFGIGLSYSVFDVSPPRILFGGDLLGMSGDGRMKHQFVSLSFGTYL